MLLDQSTFLERIIGWARKEAGIRAAFLVGSGARQDHPADEWSDIDLVLVATDPRAWLYSIDWLAQFGEVWFSYPERHGDETPVIERRVLFASGQDVDFVIPSTESARQRFAGTFIPEIASRGRRVLLDKDEILPALPVEAARQPAQPPPEGEYAEVVQDFWYHTAWTAKKLRRGELWVAIRCCDYYLKFLLLRVLEWQVAGADTWFNGRFLEQWAAPESLVKLRRTFAHYETEDVWQALRATMELFDQAARQVAGRWGYGYPVENVGKVIRWVEECKGSE
jgi:aminoglycoside 6-adenylyltransferase